MCMYNTEYKYNTYGCMYVFAQREYACMYCTYKYTLFDFDGYTCMYMYVIGPDKIKWIIEFFLFAGRIVKT